jgi:hypothetical protein
MNNFWKQYKPYFIGCFILAGVWLSFQFGILRLNKMISEKANLIQEKKLDQENRLKRIQELPKLEEQYQLIDKNSSSLEVLVQKEEELKLIETLEKIGDETGNEIKIEIQDTTKNDPAAQKKEAADKAKNSKDQKNDDIISPASDSYLKMNLLLTGSYNNLVDFVKKIESMAYWSDILSVSSAFEKAEANERSGDIFSSSSTGINNGMDKKQVLKTNLMVVFYEEK